MLNNDVSNSRIVCSATKNHSVRENTKNSNHVRTKKIGNSFNLMLKRKVSEELDIRPGVAVAKKCLSVGKE